MLKMDKVTKKYRHRGEYVTALDNASVTIHKGDFVSVVGPSGCGKSTLLLMLGGMLSPTSGRVLLDGESIYDLNSDQRAGLRTRNVGFVFQTFNLVSYLTALENVQIPMYLAGLDEAAQEERAANLLERVGLGDRLHHKPCELSVGQQQRVALARMLANDPAVILADEPTGNLDPDTSRQVIGYFEEFNQEGKTIVMVTHDPRAAERAQRTLRLTDGKIVAGDNQRSNSMWPDKDDGVLLGHEPPVTLLRGMPQATKVAKVVQKPCRGKVCGISWPSRRRWLTNTACEFYWPWSGENSASAKSWNSWGWRRPPSPSTCPS